MTRTKSTAALVQQLKAFPRAVVLVERRGSSSSNLVGEALEEAETRIPGTYIGVVEQDSPEVAEALGITESPTVIIFEGGKEKCRAGFDQLLEGLPDS